MIRRSEHPQHPPGTSRGAEAPPLHRIKRLGCFGGVTRRFLRCRWCGGVGSRAGCRRGGCRGRVGPNGYCRRPAVLVVERAGAGAVVDGAEGPLVDGVVEASIADTASQDGAFLVGAAAAAAVVDVKAGHQLSRTGNQQHKAALRRIALTRAPAIAQHSPHTPANRRVTPPWPHGCPTSQSPPSCSGAPTIKIVDADYGRAYAQVIPGARVELLTETGHSPQLETPAQVLKALNDKVSHRPRRRGLIDARHAAGVRL